MCLLNYLRLFYGTVPIASSTPVCCVQGCCAQRDQRHIWTQFNLCGLKVEVPLTCDFKSWSPIALNCCWKATAQPPTTLLSPIVSRLCHVTHVWQWDVSQHAVGPFWTKWMFSLHPSFSFPLLGTEDLNHCMIVVSTWKGHCSLKITNRRRLLTN